MITTEMQQAKEALTVTINRRRDSLNQSVKIVEPIHVLNPATGAPFTRARCTLEINGKRRNMSFHPDTCLWKIVK